MSTTNHIDYIEFPMSEPAAIKKFYTTVFQWTFTDWGENYISFDGAGIDGGFNGFDDAKVVSPGVLPVIYAENLVAKLDAVRDAGGEIVKEIYEFPGGKRFHFLDPAGNELAVWSDI